MRNQIERLRKNEKGFTLIELLVVIIILGILAAVVVFAVSGINDKGSTSACKIDTRTIRTAEEAYFAQQPSPGAYGNETQLKDGGFLSDASSYHDVTTATSIQGSGTSTSIVQTYTITVKDSKCGTIDGVVGTSGNL